MVKKVLLTEQRIEANISIESNSTDTALIMLKQLERQLKVATPLLELGGQSFVVDRIVRFDDHVLDDQRYIFQSYTIINTYFYASFFIFMNLLYVKLH